MTRDISDSDIRVRSIWVFSPEGYLAPRQLQGGYHCPHVAGEMRWVEETRGFGAVSVKRGKGCEVLCIPQRNAKWILWHHDNRHQPPFQWNFQPASSSPMSASLQIRTRFFPHNEEPFFNKQNRSNRFFISKSRLNHSLFLTILPK